jgi:hypothetical protein
MVISSHNVEVKNAFRFTFISCMLSGDAMLRDRGTTCLQSPSEFVRPPPGLTYIHGAAINSRNGSKKAKFAYLCTSGCCRIRNTLPVKLCTSWEECATAGSSHENRGLYRYRQRNTSILSFIGRCYFIATCFGSVCEPSSGNVHIHIRNVLYLQRIRCFFGSNYLSVFTMSIRMLNIHIKEKPWESFSRICRSNVVTLRWMSRVSVKLFPSGQFLILKRSKNCRWISFMVHFCNGTARFRPGSLSIVFRITTSAY